MNKQAKHIDKSGNSDKNTQVHHHGQDSCCHDDDHQGQTGAHQKEGHQHKDKHDHDHDHDHSDINHSHDEGSNSWKKHWDLLLALAILLTLLILEYGFDIGLPAIPSLIVNSIAYLLAGWPVLKLAFRKSMRGDFFNEFVLMTVATIGAFIIGEYEEGVAVMVFYQVGEWFQDTAVDRAKRSIKSLLDIRPGMVSVIRHDKPVVVDPSEVEIGELIEIKPGEKVALDGELVSEQGSFNTSALTGESKPDTKYRKEKVYAGMISLNTVVRVQVSSLFKDSKLSQILSMVQDATARKSKTQLFISRFARVYTPIVFFLALAVCLGPALFIKDYQFTQWFYRALVFLVISCPCALVVSIPLGYFGGIGLASRNGLLFKGGNFLDVMTKIDTVVMDKTGTLTRGVFRVQEVVSNIDKDEFLRLVASLESNSTHPVAKAVTEYAGSTGDLYKAVDVEEISGHGLKGTVNGRELLAGNIKLLGKFNIKYPAEAAAVAGTVVVAAANGKYIGYLTIADELKDDAPEAIRQMHALNLKTVMLSGDKKSVAEKIGSTLGISEVYGDLLPEDKVEKVQQLKNNGRHVAFVGDGVNDAPVIALADAGIAMGGLGSDATIETADIVIQNDQPTKIVSAIRVGKITRNIVWQNIILAMTVKIVVLALGAGGVATLWEAVIADVGVALLAILNAARIQKMKL